MMFALILAGVIVAGYLVYGYMGASARRQQLVERIQPVLTDEQIEAEQRKGGLVRQTYYQRIFGNIVPEDNLPSFFKHFGMLSRRAGYRTLGSLEMLTIIVVAGLILGGIVSRLPFKFVRTNVYQFSGFAFAFGALAPYMVMRFIAGTRIQKTEEQLADALGAMVGALQAGIGARQAIVVAKSSARDPIKTVLTDVVNKTELGIPVPQAFREECGFMNSKYFDLLVIALAANFTAGAALTPMLQGLVQRIRDSVRLRRRIQSLTAEARMSAVVLFSTPIFLGILVFLKNPDNLIFMLNDPVGWLMSKIVMVLYCLGLLWMASMLKFDDA